MRRKHPFSAATDGPAGSAVGALGNLNTCGSDVCTCMYPGAAALKVEQPSWCHCVSEAGRNGVKPLIIEVSHVACEWTGYECSTFAVACVIKQFADADHKAAAELVIAADLTAPGKARTVCRNL